MVQKLGRTKIVLKVGEISAKDDILKVQERQISYRANRTKIIPEMNPWQIELETRWLKVVNMWMKKRIEEEKEN